MIKPGTLLQISRFCEARYFYKVYELDQKRINLVDTIEQRDLVKTEPNDIFMFVGERKGFLAVGKKELKQKFYVFLNKNGDLFYGDKTHFQRLLGKYWHVVKEDGK